MRGRGVDIFSAWRVREHCDGALDLAYIPRTSDAENEKRGEPTRIARLAMELQTFVDS
jgi:hypothetical protein